MTIDAQWVFQKDFLSFQSKNLNHGLSVNLDPGLMILDTFFRIEDCAKTI